MPYNGTAVEGVCVTGEASRILVPFVSREAVPVARRYGAIFAIMVSVGVKDRGISSLLIDDSFD